MTRRRIRTGLAGVVAAIAILASGCGNENGTNSDGGNGGRTQISVPSGGIADPGPADVEIHNFRFEDETHTISVGDTVMWVNEGSAPHTVNLGDDLGSSGTIRTGNGFEFQFDEPGTYEYVCDNHPMEGTIIVE